jgi:hypothetical protein
MVKAGKTPVVRGQDFRGEQEQHLGVSLPPLTNLTTPPMLWVIQKVIL